MKKILKRCLALAVVLCLMLPLCACSGALEEMRSNQAILQDDGTFLWNGITYKRLNHNGYLSPVMDMERTIYLTLPDVPVLLCETEFSSQLIPSLDGRFLEYHGAYDFIYYYCRQDEFDAMEQRLSQEFVPEKVCYHYYTMDKDGWNYEEKIYILTQEQQDALTLVMTTVEPVSNIKPAHQESVSLYDCSADTLQQRYAADLLIGGGRYYLQVETDSGALTFTVPDGCKAVFDEMLEAYESFWGQITEEEAGI